MMKIFLSYFKHFVANGFFFFPLILFQDPITTMEILERSASACGLKYKCAYQKKKKCVHEKEGKPIVLLIWSKLNFALQLNFHICIL